MNFKIQRNFIPTQKAFVIIIYMTIECLIKKFELHKYNNVMFWKNSAVGLCFFRTAFYYTSFYHTPAISLKGFVHHESQHGTSEFWLNTYYINFNYDHVMNILIFICCNDLVWIKSAICSTWTINKWLYD